MRARSRALERPAVEAGRPEDDRHFVNSLARGLQVLACFRSSDKTLTNMEIAKRCQLAKSTVSRLTYTLNRLGYLTYVEDIGQYALGVATLSLSGTFLAQIDAVRKAARPRMQELADSSRSMVAMAMNDRLSMVYVETCRSSEALTLSLSVGSKVPVAKSSIGRAWLCELSEAARAEFLEQVKSSSPEEWPVIEEGIKKAQDSHAKLGVTCSFGDWQAEVNAIACAFRSSTGEVLAINCGGPAFLLPPSYLLEEVRPRLLSLVETLRLGS